MAVTYKVIDRELVSQEWYALLSDIRAAGVSFNVNEGHRTMARQWHFWRLYRSGRGNLAAFPSPNAPHIRTGRFDHAIDFNNANAVYRAALNRGVRLTWTVRGENWHLEANASQLRAYYLRHRGHPLNGFKTLKIGSNGSRVRDLQLMLRGLHYFKGKTSRFFGRKTRASVRAFQRKHGLRADGVYGQATSRKLHAVYKAHH